MRSRSKARERVLRGYLDSIPGRRVGQTADRGHCPPRRRGRRVRCGGVRSPLRPTRGVLAEPIGQGAVEVGGEVALDAPAFAGRFAEAQQVLLAGGEGRVRHGGEVGLEVGLRQRPDQGRGSATFFKKWVWQN